MALVRDVRKWFVVLAIAYVLLRVRAVLHAPPDTSYPDTDGYLKTAAASLFSRDFWAGLRSPGVALFFKLFGTPLAREIGHIVLSIVAWLALASEVERTLVDRRAKALGVFAVLAFSLSSWVVQWDPILLSESFALSSTTALIACVLSVIRNPTWPRLVLLVVLGLVWTTVRDTHAYVLLVALMLPCVWWVRARMRSKPTFVIAAFAIIAMGSITSADIGLRWKGPLTNVVGDMILRNADATAFFHERGLPQLSPRIVALLETPSFIDTDALAREPGWPDVERWLSLEGKRTYTRYLVTHPAVALATAWKRRNLALDIAEEERKRDRRSPPIGLLVSST